MNQHLPKEPESGMRTIHQDEAVDLKELTKRGKMW